MPPSAAQSGVAASALAASDAGDLGAFDVAVVGGGINGCGVAREAVYKGYRTVLLEQNDFASATSSQSSKLIHGGIRYLETGEFALVWEALHERRTLLEIAPHLVKPLELIIPIYRGSVRPPWMVRLGTILYDLLAGRQNIGGSRRVPKDELARIPYLRQEGLRGAVAYFDAQTLDSRLTLETALTARQAGATVLNYHPVTQARLEGGVYRLTGTSTRTGAPWTCTARCVVNATGPWAPFFERKTMAHATRPMVYDRGIHFVIPSLGIRTGLALMGSDRRLIFVLPWREKFTLIGTTESRFEGEDFTKVPPSEQEIVYLLDTFNEFFPERRLKRDEVLHIYSGVRTLLTGGGSLSKLSRESEVVIESDAPGTAWVMLFGGKLTSYRSYAAGIVAKLLKLLPPSGMAHAHADETSLVPLVGGGPEPDIAAPVGLHPDQMLVWRKRYGSRWGELAARVARDPAAAAELVPSHRYLQADLEYMVDEELAYRLEDLTLRRTKMTYDMTAEDRARLERALAAYLARKSVAQPIPAPVAGAAGG
jgi:glycerol-3-phosphate dehydrogenase